MKSQSHLGSRGARWARGAMFSSEARQALEKVFARTERATERAPEAHPWTGEDPTKILLESRDPQNLEVSLRSPEAETPLFRGPLLKLPREEPPGLGGPTKAPKAEKVRELDPAKPCLPGTETIPSTQLDQLALLPRMLQCDDRAAVHAGSLSHPPAQHLPSLTSLPGSPALPVAP